MLRPGQSTGVAIAFGVLGFAMMPLLPVSFESAVECTYPVNEETSSGMLMLAGMRACGGNTVQFHLSERKALACPSSSSKLMIVCALLVPFVLVHTAAAGNCFGIAIVFLLGYLVTLRTTFVDVYSPASIFIVSVMAACLGLLLTFQGANCCFDFLCPSVFTLPPFHCFFLFINNMSCDLPVLLSCRRVQTQGGRGRTTSGFRSRG